MRTLIEVSISRPKLSILSWFIKLTRTFLGGSNQKEKLTLNVRIITFPANQ